MGIEDYREFRRAFRRYHEFFKQITRAETPEERREILTTQGPLMNVTRRVLRQYIRSRHPYQAPLIEAMFEEVDRGLTPKDLTQI